MLKNQKNIEVVIFRNQKEQKKWIDFGKNK